MQTGWFKQVRVKDIDSEDFRGFTVRGCRHINHGRKRKRLSMTSTPPTHCRECGQLLPPPPDLELWRKHEILAVDYNRQRMPHENICFVCHWGRYPCF
jgi:hypothetical protein